MNNLVSYSALDSARINKENYTSELISEAYRLGLISEDETVLLKSRSMEALAEVIGYYTKNESSSVKSDTDTFFPGFKYIFRNICYIIFYNKW